MLDGALEACASGELLAVLPDHVVATLPAGTRLRRLRSSAIAPMNVYAIARTSVTGLTGLADALVRELRAEMNR